MAELLMSTTCEFETDFALLSVQQEPDELDPGVLASSAPGSIAMRCGTKYSRLTVRLEWWTGEPASAGDQWEDRDLLPWQPVEDAGPLRVFGFEEALCEPFVVQGLGPGRVEVLSWGRHRYYYGSDAPAADLPRERWLLRFWPEPATADALSGPPRRLSGRQWLPIRRTGWAAAVHAWRETGWYSALSGVTAFAVLMDAVGLAGQPFTLDELLPLMRPAGIGQDAKRYDWDSPVLGGQDRSSYEQLHPEPRAHLQRIADMSGLASLDTFGDAFTALRRLGLLAQLDGEQQRFVPNAAPPQAAWEAMDIDSPRGWGPRAHALEDFRALSEDLQHLLRWAPHDRFEATPQQLAIRLAVGVNEVLGALHLLEALGHTLTPPATELLPHTVLRLQRNY